MAAAETYPQFYARGRTIFFKSGPGAMSCPLCEVSEWLTPEEGEGTPAEVVVGWLTAGAQRSEKPA